MLLAALEGSCLRLAFSITRSSSDSNLMSFVRFPLITSSSDLGTSGGGAEASKDIEDAEEGRDDAGGVAVITCPLFFTKLLKAASVPGFLIAQ
jgi:hypothetical protein